MHNPYWKKLHEHIDLRTVDNWCDDHDQILKALLRKIPTPPSWRCGSIWKIPSKCCSTKPAMTLNLMPIATYLPKTQSFISIPQSTARNKALSSGAPPARLSDSEAGVSKSYSVSLCKSSRLPSPQSAKSTSNTCNFSDGKSGDLLQLDAFCRSGVGIYLLQSYTGKRSERLSSDHNLIKILSPYMPRAQTCR